MFRFLRFLWKVFVLASVFGIGYIIGREHSFEEEEDWDSDEDSTDSSASAADEKKPDAPVATEGGKMTAFEFADGKATTVAVIGDFNDWNKDKNPLKLENGTWRCDVSLKPGRHEYKFVVNNTDWIVDPKCSETAPDKYGGRSSVLTVS